MHDDNERIYIKLSIYRQLLFDLFYIKSITKRVHHHFFQKCLFVFEGDELG